MLVDILKNFHKNISNYLTEYDRLNKILEYLEKRKDREYKNFIQNKIDDKLSNIYIDNIIVDINYFKSTENINVILIVIIIDEYKYFFQLSNKLEFHAYDSIYFDFIYIEKMYKIFEILKNTNIDEIQKYIKKYNIFITKIKKYKNNLFDKLKLSENFNQHDSLNLKIAVLNRLIEFNISLNDILLNDTNRINVGKFTIDSVYKIKIHSYTKNDITLIFYIKNNNFAKLRFSYSDFISLFYQYPNLKPDIRIKKLNNILKKN